jgi:hypothetical protein
MQSTIIFLSKDIFFWPVVKAAAQEVNSQLIIISRLEDSKLTTVAHELVTTCLIDLAAIEVAGLVPLVQGMRLKFAGARIVAFGSHVHEARLACAEQAGCDLVLSRGQFSSKPTAYLV